MKNTISIEPVSYGTKGNATLFEVRVLAGPPDGNGVNFDCHFWSEIDGKPAEDLGAQAVFVDSVEWDTWTESNEKFYRLLAEKAGATPVG